MTSDTPPATRHPPPVTSVKTPAGSECSFYYSDYHRGRSTEECRLVGRNPNSEPWRPALCATCPVPRIQLSNACPNLILEGLIKKKWLGLRRQVVVSASCIKTASDVAKPMAGCGHCHEFLAVKIAPP